VNLQIIVSPIITKVKGGGYSCKIEKGDIRQNGITYKDQVRRLTLDLPDGTRLVHETKGFGCDDKARKWLSEVTGGTIAGY